MTALPDILNMTAYWGDRPESREGCARRILAILRRVSAALPQDASICHPGGALERLDEVTVAASLSQRKDHGDPPQVMVEKGWTSTFSLGSEPDSASLILTCGAWSMGNPQTVFLRGRYRDDQHVNHMALSAICEHFEPEYASVYSRRASQRRAIANAPFPIFDWMVYIANVTIPPEALPMVHSVERVGSGTLVILKKERLHLDRPEDLALLEAAEPIIRSFIPPPPAAPPRTLQ